MYPGTMRFWSVVGAMITMVVAFVLVLAILCLCGDLMYQVTKR